MKLQPLYEHPMLAQNKPIELSQYCRLFGEDIVAFNTSEKKLFLVGTAEYVDIFGQPHSTSWALTCDTQGFDFTKDGDNSFT